MHVCVKGRLLGWSRGAGSLLRVAPAGCALRALRALRAWVLRAWGRGERKGLLRDAGRRGGREVRLPVELQLTASREESF